MNDDVKLPDVSDLQPRLGIYLADLLTSSILGWTLFFSATNTDGLARVALVILSSFALYRAFMFLHELTHLPKAEREIITPIWHLVSGVPLLCPSFLYVGVHEIHHSRHHFATDRDFEYLALGRFKFFGLLAYLISAALAPFYLITRAIVLVPLGLFSVTLPPRRYPI